MSVLYDSYILHITGLREYKRVVLQVPCRTCFSCFLSTYNARHFLPWLLVTSTFLLVIVFLKVSQDIPN